ncbi:MAG TPA: exodeoxyribonuclease VII small subunit [Thermoanaerobaculia bacterium]|nr:exodeoxyribonuclease VII small subunit [Thermoanaerobaculia bacterium]
MSKGKTESLPKSLTFEKALSRLQEIVSELEDPDKGLEASLELFEEGVGLSRFCRSRIDEIEKRVEVVLRETPDALVTEPLDDELDEDALDGEEPER